MLKKELLFEEYNSLKFLLNQIRIVSGCPESDDVVKHIKQLSDKSIVRDFNFGLAKKTMTGIEDFDDIDTMSPDERKMFVSEASMIYRNNAFQNVCKKIISNIKNFAALQTDANEFGQAQLMISRGTINGVQLILDEMEKMMNEHKENLRTEIQMNRPKPIDDTTQLINNLIPTD